VSMLNRVERQQESLTADNFLRIAAWLLQRAENGPRVRR